MRQRWTVLAWSEVFPALTRRAHSWVYGRRCALFCECVYRCTLVYVLCVHVSVADCVSMLEKCLWAHVSALCLECFLFWFQEVVRIGTTASIRDASFHVAFTTAVFVCKHCSCGTWFFYFLHSSQCVLTLWCVTAMTAAKKARATKLFRKLDIDHNNRISSGAVYSALSQLDRNLTEEQLDYAASRHKTLDLKGFLAIYSRLELGNSICRSSVHSRKSFCNAFTCTANDCLLQTRAMLRPRPLVNA